jgi:hexokinase
MSDPLEPIRQAFRLNNEIFKSIVNGFKAEYNSGLETAEASGLATMIPSYVTSLPSGNEKGTYLSLDLGGSTLRICAVELQGYGKVNVTEIKRQINPNDPLRTTHVVEFFDWMTDAISELLVKIGHKSSESTKPLSLGICWSFPIE